MAGFKIEEWNADSEQWRTVDYGFRGDGADRLAIWRNAHPFYTFRAVEDAAPVEG